MLPTHYRALARVLVAAHLVHKRKKIMKAPWPEVELLLLDIHETEGGGPGVIEGVTGGNMGS